jgi:predicted transcriptional regulator
MTSDQLKRRLATIPAADTVGPLRLMEVDEAGAIERRRNSQTPM